MKRMILKILMTNRRVVERAAIFMFMLGCLFCVYYGIFILAGETIELDMSNEPLWLGYLVFYIGIVCLVMFALEGIVRFWGFLKLVKWSKKSLIKRIESKEEIDEIIELNPENPTAYFNRGLIYVSLRKYYKAVTDFTEAINIKPNYADAYYNRGGPNRWIGELDNAIADFKEAAKLNPKLIGSFYIIACYYSLQSKYDDALVYLEKAVSRDKMYREMAKTEKDFDNIRDVPQFKKLINEEEKD